MKSEEPSRTVAELDTGSDDRVGEASSGVFPYFLRSATLSSSPSPGLSGGDIVTESAVASGTTLPVSVSLVKSLSSGL